MSGLRALVTGGASGIGLAAVARLRADGYRVAALDRDAAALDGVEADVRRVADVTDPDGLYAAIEEAVAELGGLDAVVASAGIAGRGTVVDTPLDDWDATFAVNVRGVYLTARSTIPHLAAAGGGSFVAIASQLALVGVPASAAYCASKGAVVNLVRAMAIDHGPAGVRVNCVCPGPTETPLLDRFFAATADPAATRVAFAAMQVHGRMVEPAEIADAIAYLASPGAASTTGHALVVDGGYTIR
jgi:2-keto-3-deoxy-L-fuconate dehydrogenase